MRLYHTLLVVPFLLTYVNDPQHFLLPVQDKTLHLYISAITVLVQMMINLKDFKMFKWFSNSLGFVIEQMIPKKTKFLGVDFIFESHPLERNRFRYLFDDIYLTSLERPFDRGDLFLSQYVISVTKF